MPNWINPMAFVTPYTAPSGNYSGGNDLANAMQGLRQSKISQGYLDLQNRQENQNEKRYGYSEIDKARAALDDAILKGNQDEVEAAANNLREVGGRFGYSIAEDRSDTPEQGGVSTPQDKRKAAPVGSEENPLDLDEYERQQAAPRPPGGSLPVRSELTGQEKAPAELEKDFLEQKGDWGPPPPGGSLPVAKAEAAADLPAQPPIRGYTLHGPDGKPVYSVSPRDVVQRQRFRVGSVFGDLSKKTQDPQEQEWLGQAQTEAEKLLPVVGPEKAVAEGLKWFIGRVNGANKIDIVKANKRGGGAGVGGPGLMGKTQDVAESVQVYDDNARQEAAKIQDEDRQFEVMEQKLSSGDPAIQRDAVNDLLKLRSGTAVTASEDARIQQINGMLPKIQNMLGRWTGGDMSPEFLHTMQQIVSLKRQANKAKIQRIYAHQAELYKAQNEGKTKDPEVLKRRAKVLEEGGGAPEPGSEEGLY